MEIEKKRRSDRGKLRGSFTVEASLIMPIVLAAIVFVIYMAFLIHDRTLLTQAAYRAAFRGSRMLYESDGNINAQTQKAADDFIKGRLLALTGVRSIVRVEKEEIQTEYKGQFRIPAGVLIEKLLFSNGVSITVDGKAQKRHAVKFIRDCRKLQRLKEKIETEHGKRETQ